MVARATPILPPQKVFRGGVGWRKPLRGEEIPCLSQGKRCRIEVFVVDCYRLRCNGWGRF